MAHSFPVYCHTYLWPPNGAHAAQLLRLSLPIAQVQSDSNSSFLHPDNCTYWNQTFLLLDVLREPGEPIRFRHAWHAHRQNQHGSKPVLDAYRADSKCP